MKPNMISLREYADSDLERLVSLANNENVYRGVAPRSFDAKSHQWSIWWMDSRMPTAPMDPPVRGSFHNGVGTFYADDTENGKRIRIRFIWSKNTPTSCHWEQAYSPDGGCSRPARLPLWFERRGALRYER